MAKVTPGQSLDGALSAATWNRVEDLVNRGNMGRGGGRTVGLGGEPPAGCVLVRNDSGDDRGRYEVLALDGILVESSSSEQAWKNQICFKGLEPVWPTHIGKFAVLLEPIPDGKIGVAMVWGAIRVKLRVVHGHHNYADINQSPESGEECWLRTNHAGGAEILHYEDYGEDDAIGPKWAYVRIGAFHSPMMRGYLEVGEELQSEQSAEVQVQYPSPSGGAAGWEDGISLDVVQVYDSLLQASRKLNTSYTVHFTFDRVGGIFVAQNWKECSVLDPSPPE